MISGLVGLLVFVLIVSVVVSLFPPPEPYRRIIILIILIVAIVVLLQVFGIGPKINLFAGGVWEAETKLLPYLLR